MLQEYTRNTAESFSCVNVDKIHHFYVFKTFECVGLSEFDSHIQQLDPQVTLPENQFILFVVVLLPENKFILFEVTAN